MKELIRSYNLCKLINTPLTNVLINLEEAIGFIQSILIKLVLKTDDNNQKIYFYFIGDKLYLKYDLINNSMWCRYYDFWEVLEVGKFDYDYSDVSVLLKYTIEEYFKYKIVTTDSQGMLKTENIEDMFKKSKYSFNCYQYLDVRKAENFFKKKV